MMASRDFTDLGVPSARLLRARNHLADALAALGPPRGDTVMATPALQGLLLDAIAARRELHALESEVAAGKQAAQSPR
jgi:hypothetical protein